MRHIDYAYIKCDNDKHKATVLTMCGSTTGLGFTTVQPKNGILNIFLRHSNGKTSYERNWQKTYTQPLLFYSLARKSTLTTGMQANELTSIVVRQSCGTCYGGGRT
eukprot:1185924-Amphidinium_carterae.1